MSRQALIDQVAGILVRHEIKYATRSDGEEYLARFGSVGVHIGFMDVEDATVVMVFAPVVLDLEVDEAARHRLLERLNQVNRDLVHGRIYLHDKTVRLESEISGEDLEAGSLMRALSQVARLADTLDDELVRDYGGLTFGAKWDQGEDGEPVET